MLEQAGSLCVLEPSIAEPDQCTQPSPQHNDLGNVTCTTIPPVALNPVTRTRP